MSTSSSSGSAGWRCGNCGMLGIRRRSDWLLVDAHEGFRAFGSAGQAFSETPVCGAGMRDFALELKSKATDWPQDPPEIREMLAEDQSECQGWTRWIIGATPREHIDMQERMRLEEQRQRDRKSDRWFQIVTVLLVGIFGLLSAALGAFIARGS